MSNFPPITLGQRLDRHARTMLARLSEPARRAALRERLDRHLDSPGERRLRVEIEVPPAWDTSPGYEWAESTPPVGSWELLRPLVGDGLDRAMLHDGGSNDDAAVTVGQQIFLREGRFRPETARGRGLLAHEAVHAVLDTRPGVGWRRSTAAVVGKVHGTVVPVSELGLSSSVSAAAAVGGIPASEFGFPSTASARLPADGVPAAVVMADEIGPPSTTSATAAGDSASAVVSATRPLAHRADPSSGLAFPVGLREMLRPLVGDGLDRAVLHDGDSDPAADSVTRQHDAAAVTVGQHTFIREGRFRPDTARGRGLLAHEAVHASLGTRPGTGWRRSTAAGRAEEERAAHAVGAAVAAATVQGVIAPTGENGLPSTAVPSVVPATRLLTHRLDIVAGHPSPFRSLGIGHHGGGDTPGPVSARRASGPKADAATAAGPFASRSTAAAAAPMAAPIDDVVGPMPPMSTGPSQGVTRDEVLRELMRQVRTDRERGA